MVWFGGRMWQLPTRHSSLHYSLSTGVITPLKRSWVQGLKHGLDRTCSRNTNQVPYVPINLRCTYWTHPYSTFGGSASMENEILSSRVLNFMFFGRGICLTPSGPVSTSLYQRDIMSTMSLKTCNMYRFGVIFLVGASLP